MLLDDKPFAALTPFKSNHTIASWKHVIFDQPYNSSTDPTEYRLHKWIQWKEVLYPLLGYGKLLSSNGNKSCNSCTANYLEIVRPKGAGHVPLEDQQFNRQCRSESLEMFQVSVCVSVR